MEEIKLVFTGNMGAGKTTAIAAISEIPVINTDVAMSEKSRLANKSDTTVALDYGEISLDEGQKLRLYGTPGQQRFDFMWPILAKNALGLIILIDNGSNQPMDELNLYLDSFAELIAETSAVIGITHMDDSPRPELSAYFYHLEKKGLQLPVFPVDVREKDDVVMLIQTLLAMLEFAE